MTTLNRRNLLVSASALGLCSLGRSAWGQASGPPVASIRQVTETIFGTTVIDPYRWMENERDRDWLPFLRGQDDYARAVLRNLPQRPRLLQRIRRLSAETVITSDVQREGGRTFLERRPRGAENYQLFVRENGVDRLLVDPTLLDADGEHHALDWWNASPDGSHVVYGLSRDGSEDSVLHVLRVADAAVLPDRIADTQNATPQWLSDSSGFFYNQLTGEPDTPERYLDSRARLHRLGTDPATDPIVMQRGLVPGVEFDRIQMPAVLTFPGERHVVLALTDVRTESRWLVASLDDVLAGRNQWKPLAGFEDEITH
ncbi:MAG: S9 family peptidase, partial [Alphaproteobacteria bacterium]